MQFELKIEMDNAAYHDQPVQYELIQNLKDVIKALEDSRDYGIVRDVNGNTVGDWYID